MSAGGRALLSTAWWSSGAPCAALSRATICASLAATIGEAHATFARVPLEKLAALGSVLARLKLPEG